MIPPTTKGIESSPTSVSPSCEPEAAALSASFDSFSDVAIDIEEGPSSRPSDLNVDGGSSSSGKAKIEYDPDYFIESTFVVFQVENTLFRVPTYMLTNGSQLFSGMFRLPQPTNDGDSMEGLSASNPIVIPAKLNIKSGEFKAFIKALYPQNFSPTLHLSKAEWIAVLKLSRIWYFLDVRRVAIAELEKGGELSYIDKIVLGRVNWISSWVTDGLVGIARRDETVWDEDIIQIDYITAVRLLRMREFRFKCESRNCIVRDPTEEVQTVFSEELAHIASEEQAFNLPEPEIPFVLPDKDERRAQEEREQINEQARLAEEAYDEILHQQEEEQRWRQQEEEQRRREEAEQRRREEEESRRVGEEEAPRRPLSKKKPSQRK